MNMIVYTMPEITTAMERFTTEVSVNWSELRPVGHNQSYRQRPMEMHTQTIFNGRSAPGVSWDVARSYLLPCREASRASPAYNQREGTSLKHGA